MGENLSFGYWVRRRRKALDLTQAELGRRAGASEAMIRKIEADERRPSRELAELLAEHLAVPKDEQEAFLLAARSVTAAEALPMPTGLPTDSPPPLPSPSNLPAPMTSMVNRLNDLAAVTALLHRVDVRLLTILGPPGMGKTRLSIQAAEQMRAAFPDGVWFVDLSVVTDPALILPSVALVLNLSLAPGKPVLEQLQDELRNRRILLVLDNFEQVVDGAALEVAGLLRACKRLKVLVTSRVRLDVYGEFEYPLSPMSLPPTAESYQPDEMNNYEAVQLFIARTRQHRPDFVLTAENVGLVAEICRRMEGLPLALELAAARTRRMPVEDLATALRDASGRDWHALLQSSTRDLPPRQQALFNAVAWSYSLLDPPAQTMLAQLSVFAGPFDWAAVAAIIHVPGLEDETALRDALERLEDHNLLSRVSRMPERWRLLEMVREFARELLGAAEYRAVSERHAQYFADALTHLLHNTSGKEYYTQAEAIADNGRAALRWALESGETTLAYRLSAAFEWYWEQRGLLGEGRRYLERTLALPGEVDDDLRYDVLHGAANQAWMQHDHDEAHIHVAAGLTLARDRGDFARIAGFLNQQARIFLEEGRYEHADEALIEGIGLGRMQLRDLDPRFMIIQRGEAALGMGQLQQAEALLMEGLAGVPKEKVIPFCVGWTNLAEVALEQGDAARAHRALLQVAPVASLHFRRMRVFLVAVSGYALLQAEKTQVAKAVAMLGYVTEANRRLGDPLSRRTQLLLAGRIAGTQERLDPDTWRAVWADGQRMTAEQVLATAKDVLENGT